MLFGYNNLNDVHHMNGMQLIDGVSDEKDLGAIVSQDLKWKLGGACCK